MAKQQLRDIYHKEVLLGKILANTEQQAVINDLQILANNIYNKNFWDKFKTYKNNIYLWGSVGIGKTFLLDLFYKNLAIKNKHRWHIVSLLHLIDHKLRALQGQKNPMQRILHELFHNTRVVCLDELYVSDASQAELLNQCFEYWRKQRIYFVITSNTAPQNLFAHGKLQQKFLPAINIIIKHAKIISFQQQFDYRTQPSNIQQNYFYPQNITNLLKLRHKIQDFMLDWQKNGTINILDRPIKFIRKSSKIIWFNFKDICATPRSQLDYLALCKEYEIFVLANIPKLKENDTPSVILLMHLIDIIYDHNKTLLCISDTPLEEIYTAGPLINAFSRTKSRIIELSSMDLPNNS